MIRPLCAAGLLTLAACAGESLSTQTPATQTLLASPAALNCTAHHGRIIIRQTGSGSKGFCTLPGNIAEPVRIRCIVPLKVRLSESV